VKTETERAALASPEPDAKAGQERRKNPVLRFLGEMPGLILMSLLLAILIKTFLVQAFYIPSGSMLPTLRQDDRILVTKVPYYFREPKRGDIIVFEDPNGDQPDRGVVGGAVRWLFQGIGIQKPDQEDFIKRVIGEPGDEVWAKDGQVFVNGVMITEDYTRGTTTDFRRLTVPDDMYFVLGDNRPNSEDSRMGLGVHALKSRPEIGFIPREDIIGKAFVIVWPVDEWGRL
jgi:signal peptidase I